MLVSRLRRCCQRLNSYIKPQPSRHTSLLLRSCQRLNSYIKPQQGWKTGGRRMVVNDWIPTSNHNDVVVHCACRKLSTTEFLHQTTTEHETYWTIRSCQRLNSYIKPQRNFAKYVFAIGCQRLNSYIKPQPENSTIIKFTSCQRLNSYIKPQPY